MNLLNELIKQKADLSAQDRPPRAREAAKTLGISEAEYVALSCGDSCISLDTSRFEELLFELEPVGELMALTRNDVMVLEHHGVYRDAQSRHGHVIFNSPDIDLRLKVSSWQSGFAVEENGRQSLQFFDEHGIATHKIYVTTESDVGVYNSLVKQYATSAGFSDLSIKKIVKIEPTKVDFSTQDFINEWQEIDNAHHVNSLLDKYTLTRPEAYRLLGDDAVILRKNALEDLLKQAVELKMPLLMFVPNSSATQIHNGTVHKLMEMGPWFNVLDPKFNLHANMSLISESWCIKKTLEQGDTYSMEIFDADNNALMMVYLHTDVVKDKKIAQQWFDLLADLV